MRITARFNGKCAKCGKLTMKGEEIEYQNKQAFHPGCQEEEGPADDRLGLAASLGYVTASEVEGMATNWVLWKMPPPH